MADYYVTVSRGPGGGFRLQVAGLGWAQCTQLTRARESVEGLFASRGRVLDDDDALVFRLPGELGVYLENARRARSRAVEAQVASAIAHRQLVHQLQTAGGFKGVEVAVILGVSPQRVSQLVSA